MKPCASRPIPTRMVRKIGARHIVLFASGRPHRRAWRAWKDGHPRLPFHRGRGPRDPQREVVEAEMTGRGQASLRQSEGQQQLAQFVVMISGPRRLRLSHLRPVITRAPGPSREGLCPQARYPAGLSSAIGDAAACPRTIDSIVAFVRPGSLPGSGRPALDDTAGTFTEERQLRSSRRATRARPAYAGPWV